MKDRPWRNERKGAVVAGPDSGALDGLSPTHYQTGYRAHDRDIITAINTCQYSSVRKRQTYIVKKPAGEGSGELSDSK